MKNLSSILLEKLSINKNTDINKEYKGKPLHEIISMICEEYFPKGRLSYQPAEDGLFIVYVYIAETGINNKKVKEILSRIEDIIDVENTEFNYIKNSTPFYYQLNVFCKK